MDFSLSLVPISCLACQEIYNILLNPNVPLCVNNCLPVTSVLNQMNPVHTIPVYKMYFYMIHVFLVFQVIIAVAVCGK